MFINIENTNILPIDRTNIIHIQYMHIHGTVKLVLVSCNVYECLLKI